MLQAQAESMDGLPPRRRGTRNRDGRVGSFQRFTPAQAGNTVALRLFTARDPVYPRAGGEHLARRVGNLVDDGLPPRRRGTLLLEEIDKSIVFWC